MNRNKKAERDQNRRKTKEAWGGAASSTLLRATRDVSSARKAEVKGVCWRRVFSFFPVDKRDDSGYLKLEDLNLSLWVVDVS
jgi:hypothetical protein